MKIEKIDNCKIDSNDLVSVKFMGNIIEVCYVQHRNNKVYIKLIDKDHYIYLPTGELREINHIDNRSNNIAEVSQSLKRLREYINTNVTDLSKCKWITLTYKENMTDTKRLYEDFKKFIMKFRYKYGHFEYIVACEPQGRGAWHMHLIIIFDNVAPFIPNSDIEKLWGHGFTKTKAFRGDVTDIGRYLTAYLGDMEYESFISSGVDYNHIRFKEIDVIDGIKLDKPKKFVKGGRLYMYPANFNLYRISRGIKKPVKEYMPYLLAKEKVGFAQPTYINSLLLTDPDSNFSNLVCYESYNISK